MEKIFTVESFLENFPELRKLPIITCRIIGDDVTIALLKIDTLFKFAKKLLYKIYFRVGITFAEIFQPAPDFVVKYRRTVSSTNSDTDKEIQYVQDLIDHSEIKLTSARTLYYCPDGDVPSRDNPIYWVIDRYEDQTWAEAIVISTYLDDEMAMHIYYNDHKTIIRLAIAAKLGSIVALNALREWTNLHREYKSGPMSDLNKRISSIILKKLDIIWPAATLAQKNILSKIYFSINHDHSRDIAVPPNLEDERDPRAFLIGKKGDVIYSSQQSERGLISAILWDGLEGVRKDERLEIRKNKLSHFRSLQDRFGPNKQITAAINSLARFVDPSFKEPVDDDDDDVDPTKTRKMVEQILSISPVKKTAASSNIPKNVLLRIKQMAQPEDGLVWTTTSYVDGEDEDGLISETGEAIIRSVRRLLGYATTWTNLQSLGVNVKLTEDVTAEHIYLVTSNNIFIYIAFLESRYSPDVCFVVSNKGQITACGSSIDDCLTVTYDTIGWTSSHNASIKTMEHTMQNLWYIIMNILDKLASLTNISPISWQTLSNF